jgi:hypothetical protein
MDLTWPTMPSAAGLMARQLLLRNHDGSMLLKEILSFDEAQ